MNSVHTPAREHDQLPVLIIGAGSCGLALANGLKNAGIPHRIFERDAPGALRYGRDWALALHWAAPVLEQLVGTHRWPEILKTQADPSMPTPRESRLQVLNGATGQPLNQLPVSGTYRLVRSKLRAFLSEDLTVEHGKKLVRFETNEDSTAGHGTRTVTAFFDDGTTAIGRLLVGADGSNSLVRRLLLLPSSPLAPQNTRLPFAATFVAATYSREQALFLRSFHPLLSLILHPDGMVGMVAILHAPDADRPEDWVFQFYVSWASSVEEQDAEAARLRSASAEDARRARWDQVYAKSAAYGQPMRSAVDWVQERMERGQGQDVGVYYGGVSNWDPTVEGRQWDNLGGLVTLVGDAAHPMTYNRGQGLNHAIADAGELCKLLATGRAGHGALSQLQLQQQQKTAIDAYETEMRKRGGEEVRLSEVNTRMLHNWDQVQASPIMRNGFGKGSEAPPAPPAPMTARTK